MSVKIRLARAGRHERAFYRVVAADSRYSKDGRYLEQIGYYDPLKGIDSAVIDEELAIKWLNNGAQYSTTVKSILSKKDLINKAKLANKENRPTKAKVVSTKAKKA
ncbi:MAG: 30S ribosomal protein S16 [Bacillales bacterium]